MTTTSTTTTLTTINPAEVEIRMANRAFVLCHTHARAFIDLADGNGVELQIAALIPPHDVPCQACWAAQPTDEPVKIIIAK